MGCIEITGRSIVDYLNEYRIRKSVWFLRESSRDIGEIAGLAGLIISVISIKNFASICTQHPEHTKK